MRISLSILYEKCWSVSVCDTDLSIQFSIRVRTRPAYFLGKTSLKKPDFDVERTLFIAAIWEPSNCGTFLENRVIFFSSVTFTAIGVISLLGYFSGSNPSKIADFVAEYTRFQAHRTHLGVQEQYFGQDGFEPPR